MKTNQPSEHDDEQLNSVLRNWVVDTPLPPRFQEQVWRRIAKSETPDRLGFWAGLSRWIEAALPRPKVAFSYVAALLLLGVTAGSLVAQAKSTQFNASLSERYMQSIDPYRAESMQP